MGWNAVSLLWLNPRPPDDSLADDSLADDSAGTGANCRHPWVGFYQTVEPLFKSAAQAPAVRRSRRTVGSGRPGTFAASTRNSCAVTSASSNASCGFATGTP